MNINYEKKIEALIQGHFASLQIDGIKINQDGISVSSANLSASSNGLMCLILIQKIGVYPLCGYYFFFK